MATALDIDTLARTIYGEARSESQQGKRAVAFVVLNRVAKQTWYGKTVLGVCKRRWQFSCWNPNDPNREKLLAVTLDKPSFQNAYCAALSVLCGHAGADPTIGATHYHTPSVAPRWSRGKVPVVQIGKHLFFNDVR